MHANSAGNTVTTWHTCMRIPSLVIQDEIADTARRAQNVVDAIETFS